MNRDERIELKSCPFCGSKAEMAVSENERGQIYIIHCSEDPAHCWMDAHYVSGALDELAVKWNTRTDREAVLVAALEQIAMYCKDHIEPGYECAMCLTESIAAKALKEYRGER